MFDIVGGRARVCGKLVASRGMLRVGGWVAPWLLGPGALGGGAVGAILERRLRGVPGNLPGPVL
eukprot:scaffold10558_cov111-Isochrysis_galbana.AAC.4